MEKQWLRTEILVKVVVVHQFPNDSEGIIRNGLRFPAVESVEIVSQVPLEPIAE